MFSSVFRFTVRAAYLWPSPHGGVAAVVAHPPKQNIAATTNLAHEGQLLRNQGAFYQGDPKKGSAVARGGRDLFRQRLKSHTGAPNETGTNSLAIDPGYLGALVARL